MSRRKRQLDNPSQPNTKKHKIHKPKGKYYKNGWCIKEFVPQYYYSKHKQNTHRDNVKSLLKKTEWDIVIPIRYLSPDGQHRLLKRILKLNKFNIITVVPVEANKFRSPEIIIKNKPGYNIDLQQAIYYLDL
eukprot:458114_1